MASSFEGSIDGLEISIEEGTLLELGLLEGEDEGWVKDDHGIPELRAVKTLEDRDGELTRRPSRRLRDLN